MEHQYFYWEKGIYESLDVPCVHFNVEIFQMRQYYTNIFKYDTSSDDMKENIDHCLDAFESFTKIILL